MNTKKVLMIGSHSYIGTRLLQYCERIEQVSYVNGLAPKLPNAIERDGSGFTSTVTTDFIGIKKAEKSAEQIFDHKGPDITAVSGKSKEWENIDFNQYDCVLLLSGIVHQKAQPKLYEAVNHQMAVEIAKKAKIAGVKQFVFMSTIAIYGDTCTWIDGKTEPNPVSEYAKSKRLAEIDIMKMAQDTFRVVIVRPPMVYGPDCPGNFTRLVKMIRKVHVFPMIQNGRSSIYIDHLCEFLRQVILQQVSGIYIPQNAEYLCTSQIAKVMKQQGYSILLCHGLQALILLGRKLNRSLEKMFGDLKCCQTLSGQEQFKYQQISIEESLKQSIPEVSIIKK